MRHERCQISPPKGVLKIEGEIDGARHVRTAELELSFEAELPGEAGEKVEAGSARSWGADAEQALSI
jgi:hypothetical protein